jgi:CO/xanthine dehydrogenase FAD-binding subunit
MIPNIDTLVDLSELNLDYLREESDALHIGATTKLSWLMQQPIFDNPSLLGLKDVLKTLKPPQIRNVATIGGAICVSIAFLDMPAALMGLGASVKITGPTKERVVSLDNFFLDYLLPDLRKGEFVTEVIVPKSKNRAGSSFLKLGRTASDFALVNVGSMLEFNTEGKCFSPRVALGGVANIPIRVKKAEETLKGKKLKISDITTAMQAASELNPIPSIHGSPWYKKEISKILIRDSIQLSAERAGIEIEE